MLVLLRRHNYLSTVRFNPRALSGFWTFQSFASTSVNGDSDNDQSIRCEKRSDELTVSRFFCQDQSPLSSSEIKVVDSDTWELSSGLANLSKNFNHRRQKMSFCVEEFSDEACGDRLEVKDELDLDEIEDMRVHGNLFYKIDRGSKEFEEYKFDFHRRKPRSSKGDDKETEKKEDPSNNEPPLKGGKNFKCKEEPKESNKERIRRDNLFVDDELVSRIIKDKYIVCASHDNAGKKLRKPTFNQLTGPYHEPFCLDIYISKESVRACVVHRATSKVVTVAHSISKDMKFDLGSTRNVTACAAVGRVLAQRSLADDIHDVIFTPRKGDKLEGKLQVVLQSIIDNGVNVKVKLKQRNVRKAAVQHIT